MLTKSTDNLNNECSDNLSSSCTCLIFWVNLVKVSGELKPSGCSSTESSSFLTGFSIGKLEPRKADAFLDTALDLLPVIAVCVDTLGVLTTNDESDLSFLLTGNVTEAVTSGAFTFLLLKGKILILTSCKLWSGLITKNQWTCFATEFHVFLDVWYTCNNLCAFMQKEQKSQCGV